MRRGFALLLVEDDPVLGPMTAEVLQIFGHATTLAANVDTAFRELSNNDFDAIILDLGLGNESGEKLIENAREARLRVPEVLILSALPIDVLQKTQRSLNACGLLQKPISPEELVHELERCIPVKELD